MKNLGKAAIQQEIKQRLQSLRADSQRHWGRMSANQMICHLADSFRRVLGEKDAIALPPRKLMKLAALWIPIPWPHGFKTRPEMDQEIGGTGPVEFEQDRKELFQLMERFTCEAPVPRFEAHPIFGHMSRKELMRWAYLHMDHHLRQFGA
jgi:Protein of unknown function (DUF1569)